MLACLFIPWYIWNRYQVAIVLSAAGSQSFGICTYDHYNFCSITSGKRHMLSVCPVVDLFIQPYLHFAEDLDTGFTHLSKGLYTLFIPICFARCTFTLHFGSCVNIWICGLYILAIYIFLIRFCTLYICIELRFSSAAYFAYILYI